VRRSTPFLALLFLQLGLFLGMLLHAWWAGRAVDPAVAECRRRVSELRLTDLCLFTEARYTRNPALADLHTAFQDHPGALEHFPSGTLVAPPPHLTSPHAWHPAPNPKHP
jgi:hypothetical protein